MPDRTDRRLRERHAAANLRLAVRKLQPGDVLGFSAHDCLGCWINLATWGLPRVGLSHVAICAQHPDRDELVLFESTTLLNSPCILRHHLVSGLQCHTIRPRVIGYNGKVWAYRLATPLEARQSANLTAYCVAHLGTRYDALGAFRSRDVGLGWLEQRMRPEDLSSIFCSEFVAAAHREVDVFRTRSASRWSPNRYCRELLARGLVDRAERIK